MAKPKTIPYDEAIFGIEQAKSWPTPSKKLTWIRTTRKSWPFSFNVFMGLLVNEGFEEGTKVELFFKESVVPGVPNTLYMNFFYQHAIVFGVHDGPPVKHVNLVGKGRRFFRQTISHPHKHIPVEESCYGYAEPLDVESVDELWTLFKQEANIIGNIDFNYPEDVQGRLL